jgi:hypothetical protein
MLVVVCCGCVSCCGLRLSTVFYPFCKVEHLTHTDMFPLFLGMIRYTNARPKHRSHTAMHRWCVSGNKNEGVQLGLAFVFRGENVHFLHSSVHFASMIDKIVLRVKYFWTLQKN